jgi:hypothetical protein
MKASRRLDIPKSARPFRVAWIDATGIATIHLIALLAFVPWFFSWTGVVLALLGLYVFGTLGINLCFHRMLTHRSFVCPKWLEHSLAILGLCCVQDTPARPAPCSGRDTTTGSGGVASAQTWRSSELPVTSTGWLRNGCFSRYSLASTCAGGWADSPNAPGYASPITGTGVRC